MEDSAASKPWEPLEIALAERNPDAIEAVLAGLSPSEAARAFLHLAAGEQEDVLELVEPDAAASVIESLPDEPAANVMEHLEASDAAAIFEELESDLQADLLREMDEEEASAILEQMDPEDSATVRRLIKYPDDTAGGLMMAEVFKFLESDTIGTVLKRITESEEDIERYRGQHPYVVSETGRLRGVVSLWRLLTSRPSTLLSEIMAEPLTVRTNATLTELKDIFERRPFLGLPVVDRRRRLLGVVSREAVAEAELEKAESDAQKVQGIVSEEVRSMPTFLRARRRLSWLTINIGLNIMAASIIAFYEETLAAVIVLAVFLPIISDMSGCSGNQAVAVSLRELSLGITKPIDVLRVWWKEASVGLINGLALGLLIALVAFLWKGNPYIGLVVGLALGLNTLIAVSIGGTIPLALKHYGVDPAVASGPMLTTITDMFGFFLVLSLASLMLPLLI